MSWISDTLLTAPSLFGMLLPSPLPMHGGWSASRASSFLPCLSGEWESRARALIMESAGWKKRLQPGVLKLGFDERVVKRNAPQTGRAAGF